MEPRPDRDAEVIRQIVDLRRVRAAVDDPAARRRLARVSRGLRAQLDVGVPKHRVARLFGISPQALERWVGAGAIPTLRSPGSSRELVERDALIRLLGEVDVLREAGERRPLSRAIAALRDQGRLARKPRPNQPARELRYERAHSTPEERVRSAVVVSETAHTMAAQARRRAGAAR